METSTQERRITAARRRALKGAQISFHGLHAAIDCVVRDMSDTGARLSVETSVGIPQTFHLVLEGAPVRACRVIWRKASQIGVAFV